jgi:mono/diheme cytochrome c family protein
MVKRVLLAVVLVILLGGAGFFFGNALLFDRSTSKIYDIPLPNVIASSDPSVIDRGKHLVESLGKCKQCHGKDLGSGESVEHGPFGVSKGPNLTAGKNGVGYTDAELARLIKHGVKRNGRTVLYMPSNETSWWPMEDVVALISYLHTLPSVDGESGKVEFGVLAKFFDRMNLIKLDIARRIDHEVEDIPPPRAPTPEYGAYIAKLCVRCHGERFSGGPMPGAPPSLAVPSNLTPDPSGLADWTYEDLDKLLTQGIRKNGKPLDPFMSLGAMGKMDETEKRALWAYLRMLPPRQFGGH